MPVSVRSLLPLLANAKGSDCRLAQEIHEETDVCRRWVQKQWDVGFSKKLCRFQGDGGNDVSMIQAANVGIGIVGKVDTV